MLLMVILPTVTISSQIEKLRNRSFEYWWNNSGQTSLGYWRWESQGIDFLQETTDKVDGNYSMKVNNTTNAVQTFGIHAPYKIYSSADLFAAGQQFELRIKYKVLNSNNGDDVRLWSNWTKPDATGKGSEPSDADEAVLHTDWETSSTWKTVTLSLTAPSDVHDFEFKVGVNQGVTVLFDDFTFNRVAASDEVYLSISPEILPELETNINTTIQYTTVHVAFNGFTKDAFSTYLSGKDRNFFSVATTEIDANHIDWTFSYTPGNVGSHSVNQMIEIIGHPTLSAFLKVHGIGIDPSSQPTLTFNPTTLPDFSTDVNVEQTQTVSFQTANCIDWAYLRVDHVEGAAFSINNTMFGKNSTQDVTVKFYPKQVGHYASDIVGYTKSGQNVVLHVEGTATGTNPGDEVFESELVFDNQNAFALLNETFTELEHNKTYKRANWQTVVKQGNRAFWGYIEKDFNTTPPTETGLRCAKVTAYNSLATTSTEMEAWLVSPALDFKNATSKLLNFSLKMDYFTELDNGKFTVYYVDTIVGKGLFMQELNVVPNVKDQAGEWKGVRLDLSPSNMNIADVFYIAFKFTSTSDREHAKTYYVDDFSWGRSDLPAISPNTTADEFDATLNKDKKTPLYQIAGTHLTAPITVKVKGDHPSKFKVSNASLPKEGGVMWATFNGDQIGIYSGILQFSSKGAPDAFITLTVHNKKGSGVESNELATAAAWQEENVLHVLSSDIQSIAIYTVNGELIHQSSALNTNQYDLQQDWAAGVYIVKLQTAHGSETLKVTID